MSSSSGNKIIIFLGDGLGDRPVPELGGKTPLEALSTPSLDRRKPSNASIVRRRRSRRYGQLRLPKK